MNGWKWRKRWKCCWNRPHCAAEAAPAEDEIEYRPLVTGPSSSALLRPPSKMLSMTSSLPQLFVWGRRRGWGGGRGDRKRERRGLVPPSWKRAAAAAAAVAFHSWSFSYDFFLLSSSSPSSIWKAKKKFQSPLPCFGKSRDLIYPLEAVFQHW